ncbi:hypothetical protein HY029_05135, partial [Candidatus Gottesmanbacteria bacterium]|nr:hypothetical protein [Candidatus Gottesmanbacteria bacterium]
MIDIVFIITSTIYISSLIIVDGMFNRLIFRSHRKLSYFSLKKQKILKRWEWKVIGVLYLIVIPLIIPCFVIYEFLGWRYILLYLIIFSVIHWDLLFGQIVFNSWFADTPSIALPFLGWNHFSIKQTSI